MKCIYTKYALTSSLAETCKYYVTIQQEDLLPKLLRESWRRRDFVIFDSNTDLFKSSILPELFLRSK